MRGNRGSTTLFALVCQLLFIAVCLVMGIALLASFTVVPMYDNYSRCGTIFLCQGKHP